MGQVGVARRRRPRPQSRTRIGERGRNMDQATTDQAVRAAVAAAPGRKPMWAQLVRALALTHLAEIGVLTGKFAAHLLADCPGIDRYYMIDPWRRLDGWDKPANQDDDTFAAIYATAMAKTDFAQDRRIVLRGTTAEVIDTIPDGQLDLAYIDGDHTLRGITNDLIRVYPKIAEGGLIGGDDFAPDIWQHGLGYEPTLVFPFAVHFAEAVGAPIYALPGRQFLLQKTPGAAFAFVDLTGAYADTGLRRQFKPVRAATRSLQRQAKQWRKRARQRRR